MKLGKRPVRHDKRTLLLADYLTGPLPPPPAAQDWARHLAKIGMMLNDQIGDCTCAAAGHAIQIWSSNANREVTVSDADVVAAYSAITGYSPNDPSTDNGAVELDVLNYWRQTGIGGHKIAGFVKLEPKNTSHIESAIALFGGTYIGLGLPISAQNQNVWSVVGGPDGEPGSWGGHAVYVVEYDAHGLTCITWGQLKRMTWGFWQQYCDEAYGILSNDWLNPTTHIAPNGFNIGVLMADLQKVTA